MVTNIMRDSRPRTLSETSSGLDHVTVMQGILQVSQYRLLTHAEVEDPPRFHQDLCHLNALTFTAYHGVLLPTVESMRWYRTRPGMEPGICQAALCGDELVSSLFVTLAATRLGGETLKCGFIDTVMTHPAHRRRGLASALLERALAEMRAAGAEASILYADHDVPSMPPQKMYEGLGYCVHELVDRFVGRAPQAPAHDPALMIPPDVEAREAFETALSRRDGWVEMDDALWGWRRVLRPPQYPAKLYRTIDGGLCALCSGDLMSEGEARTASVLSDLVLPEGPKADDALAAMLSAAPGGATITALCPRSDVGMGQRLEGLGFRRVAVEAAMVLPLTQRAAELPRAGARSWYVAVESVIGV